MKDSHKPSRKSFRNLQVSKRKIIGYLKNKKKEKGKQALEEIFQKCANKKEENTKISERNKEKEKNEMQRQALENRLKKFINQTEENANISKMKKEKEIIFENKHQRKD